MWMDDSSPAAARSKRTAADDPDDNPADLIAVIEEALALLLGAPPETAKATARVARRPRPQSAVRGAGNRPHGGATPRAPCSARSGAAGAVEIRARLE